MGLIKVLTVTTVICIFINSALSGIRQFPTKCERFTDLRSNNISDEFTKSTVLIIPPHLTNGWDQPLKFQMQDSIFIAEATLHEMECQVPYKFSIQLVPDNPDGYHGWSTKSYPLQHNWKYKNDTYFTSDGYLHRNGHFWYPNEYCVQSISDSEIEIKSCQLKCSADLSESYLYSSIDKYISSRVCIPKCCGVDEVLSPNGQSCRKLNSTEATYFLPYLHLQNPIWYLKDAKPPVADAHKILVLPRLSERRQSWNSSHGLVGGHSSIWGYLHFFRGKMNCSNVIAVNTSYDDVKDFGGIKGARYNFRVEVHRNQVQLSFLTKSRKWLPYQNSFCVDGADNWGERDKAINQIVLLCIDDHVAMETRTFSESVKVKNDKAHESPLRFLYLSVLIFCTILFLHGSWMYFMIRKKLNFNGKVIFSHLGTVALFYFALSIALITEESEDSKVSDNAITVVNSDFENDFRRIGWFCVGIGAICHFLYISNFLWLTALNKAIRMMEHIGVYGIYGWGLPANFILLIGVVDWRFNDPWSEAVVPDYGVESCQVASWSAGYYVYLPIGLILALNFLYILVIVVKNFKRVCLEEEQGSQTNRKLEDDAKGISFRLFAIIWWIQTIGWFASLVDWLRIYNGKRHDWISISFLIFSKFLETFCLIHFYCMNEVVLGLVGEKIQRLQGIMKVLKNNKLIWKGSGKLGQIVELEEDEDNVVIEGQELLRR